MSASSSPSDAESVGGCPLRPHKCARLLVKRLSGLKTGLCPCCFHTVLSDYASWFVLRPAFTLQLKCFVNRLVCLLFQGSLALPHLPSPMSIFPLQHKVYIRVIYFLPEAVPRSGHFCLYGQARRARELILPGRSPSCDQQLHPPRWGGGRCELGTVSWRPWGVGATCLQPCMGHVPSASGSLICS